MIALMAVVVAVVAASSAFLLVYGCNLVYLSLRALRLERCGAALTGGETAEAVVVQLPVYNERYVAERVIDACARLDWPRDRLELQVLDDSDDDTPDIVARAVARWRAAGLNVNHVRRGGRAGYKAGALAHGLKLTSASLVAIFDADFVPPRDFLRRLVPALADPQVAFVQARWGHLNEDYSLFTYLQSLMTDFHFLVEQAVRARCGYPMNFVGSAGVWRRAAIEDAGGWDGRTLTEDLDLSYRAQLRGWRAAYREDVVVPQELPVSVNAYRDQQSRWATGSFQCAALLLPRIVRGGLRPTARFQAAMHLLGYAAPVAMLAQIACYPVVLAALAAGLPAPGLAVPIALSLLSLAPAAGLAVAQWRRGREWWWHWLGLLSWSVLGAGTSLTVVASLWRALRGGGEFTRTPKYRVERAGQDWRSKTYFRPSYAAAAVELGFGAATLLLGWQALRRGQPLLAVYSGLFGGGFCYLALTSLLQAMRQLRYEALALRLRVLVAPMWGLALAAAAGLVLLAAAQISDPFEDSYQHWLIAANLATAGRLEDPLFQMQDTWLPAYHVLAALVLKLLGTWQLGALKLVNAGLGLLTLVLVYRLAGTQRRGLVAAGLLALNPVFLLTATSAVAEPLLAALLVGAAAAATRRRLALAAILACLACLTGTKAWLWVGCAAAVLGGAAVLARAGGEAAQRFLPRSAPGFALVGPALLLAAALQASFGFASHSVARAAVEAGSAAVRGSVPAAPLQRAAEFLGYFALASLPLLPLLPLGLALAVRSRGGAPWLRLVALPSLLYLAVVTALVWSGAYSGSHRYYYPALPGLALLGALAVDRVRLRVALAPVAAAVLVAAAYVPVLTGLAAGNRGLQAAGAAAAPLPGALLTDSPAAAYWSGKPPAAIYGSRELPADREAAVAWLQSRGVTGLVVEDIDYYRAAGVLPDLAAGRASPPFVAVGDPAVYSVPGGKRVHVYRLGRPLLALSDGTRLGIQAGAWPGRGKTAELAKGPVLMGGPDGSDLAGGGMGFGVPIARFADGWWFPGPESALEVAPDSRSWTRTYDLDRTDVTEGGRFLRFEAGPSHGQLRVTYRVRPGGLGVEVRPLRFAPDLREVVILNEQSAGFDDYADAAQTRLGEGVGSWSPVPGDWARFRSARLGLEWAVPRPPPGGSFFAARELRTGRAGQPDIDFSGLEWVFDSRFRGVDYEIGIRRAR